jgi:hypothetical protein
MMDLSDAQLAANRANAELSTGPRTEEGKQRSSLNAMKHGLTGRTVVLPKENQEEYRAFAKRITDSLEPGTPVEEELAQVIADQYWRLRRVKAIEDELVERGEATLQHLSTLGIYVQRIERGLKEAERRLREMQTLRKKEEEEKKTEAIRVYRFHKMMDLPWDPEFNGFVYSGEELEEEIGRREMRLVGILAARWDYDRGKWEAWKKQRKERLTKESKGKGQKAK